jgi:uncharacterized membrane protein YbhN (UPF0104 family)
VATVLEFSQKRAVLATLGVVWSVVAAGTITHLPGLNLERAAADLAAAQRLPLVGAFALFMTSLACSAFAWRSAVRECGGRPGRSRSAACFGAGSFVNSLLPARLGDGVRIALFSREIPGPGRLWTTGGIFAAMTAFEGVAMVVLVAAAAALGAMPVWAVALPAGPVIAVTVVAWRARRSESHPRLLNVFRVFGRSPGQTLVPIGWLTIALGCRVAAAALTASAFGVGAPLTVAIVLVPAVGVAGLVPLTPGNLGLTTAAVAIALHTTGTGTTRAVAVGIGFHAAEIAAGLAFGLASILYLFGAEAARSAVSSPAPTMSAP